MARNHFPQYGVDSIPPEDGPTFSTDSFYAQGEKPGVPPKTSKPLPSVVMASELLVDNDKPPAIETVQSSAQLTETRMQRAERLAAEVVQNLQNAGESQYIAATKAIEIRDNELWRDLGHSSMSEFIDKAALVSRSQFYNLIRDQENRDLLKLTNPELGDDVDNLSSNAGLELAKNPATAGDDLSALLKAREKPTAKNIRKHREKRANPPVIENENPVEQVCPTCKRPLP